MNTFNLNLDLDKRGGVAQWVTLRQGDRRGTELRATIYDHGTQAGGGYTCRVSIRLPGAGDEYYRETATYTNGVAVVTVDEEYAAAIVGVTEGYFELLQGDAVIASTESFGVRILRSAQDGAVPGDKYDSAIEDALAELDEATGRISQMVVDATEEYLEAHPELTTTVEDNSLTDAKLIQHGGILDRVARLWHRLDNLLTATPAEADALTVTDAAKTPLAGLALYGRSTQSGTPTPDAPVAIESVTPNLYHQTLYAAGASYTTAGVTVTHNADGTCACTGTATATAWLWGGGSSADDRLYVSLPAGTYAACSSHAVAVQKKVDGTVSSITGYAGSGFTFTLEEETLIKVVPVIASGVTLDGETAWTALYAGTMPQRYVPYGHAGLWARGRNLVTAERWIRGGVNGTTGAIGTSTTRIVAPFVTVEPSTAYTLSWSGDYQVYPYQYSESGLIGNFGGWKSSPCTITTNASAAYVYMMMRKTGDAAILPSDAESALPMMVRGSTASAYQPYAESVTPIDLQGHTLRSLPDGTRDEVNVDQYGHAVLTQRVQLTTQAVTDGVTGTVGVDVMSSTGEIANGATVLYPLATPVTIDLGTVDPIALQGPDMTAQAVPTAPFALTYERDLNITLARLEAAIADAATS